MDANVSGAKTLLTFSPRWTNEKLLERTLAGRRELVDRLEQLARDGAGGPNKHQQLIIGVRGSGKTHVLKVLHNRLWKDEGIKKRLLIVYLLEDELGIASFLDFLVRLVRAIIEWYPEKTELAAGLNTLYDVPAASQLSSARDLLLSAVGTKDILILMENLGVTFDKTRGFGRKGQEALRDMVQQHPRFMIFATAQALTQDVSDHDYPFYGFFKITHLAKLTLAEAHAFLTSIATAYGNQGVLDFLQTPAGRGRVEAIYQFTGGNHRLLVTFYDFLCADSVAKASDLFLDALNPLRPFYQEQMRSLSAQQQKIVQYLARERTPKPVKEIARGCLAAPNTISKQLGELLDRGFLSRIEQGRESYYEMSESLFRICYEADLDQQGAPVRLFVDFLANFYTAKELQLRCRGFQLLAKTVPPYDNEAALRYRKMLEQDPKNGVTWSRLVQALAASGQMDAAMQAAEDGLQAASNPAVIYNTRGEIRRNANHFDAALDDYEKAIRVDPAFVDPHFNAVTALIALGRSGEILPRLARGIEAQQHQPPLDPSASVARFEENLTALFRYAAENALTSQLSQMAALIQSAALISGFERALGLAIFALLRDHPVIEESRYRIVESAIREALASHVDTTVILRLLSAGVQYFKQRDRKALLSLAREERELIVKELGISDLSA